MLKSASPSQSYKHRERTQRSRCRSPEKRDTRIALKVIQLQFFSSTRSCPQRILSSRLQKEADAEAIGRACGQEKTSLNPNHALSPEPPTFHLNPRRFVAQEIANSVCVLCVVEDFSWDDLCPVGKLYFTLIRVCHRLPEAILITNIPCSLIMTHQATVSSLKQTLIVNVLFFHWEGMLKSQNQQLKSRHFLWQNLRNSQIDQGDLHEVTYHLVYSNYSQYPTSFPPR